MPSVTDLLATIGRRGAGLTAALLLPGLRLASADHGAPATARPGSGWMSWLLVAGAVVAVGLAAWAFFAPDPGDGASTPADPSGPPSRSSPEPPTR